MGNVEEVSLWEKAESVIFPLAAAIIGIGYCLAILINNKLSNVFGSPHAIILLIIFAAIAFFPVKSFAKQIAVKVKEKE